MSLFGSGRITVTGGAGGGGGTGTVTGTGAAGQAAYWVGASEIAGNAAYLYTAPVAGSATSLLVSHTSNTASSDATITARVAGTSAGDAIFLLDVTGGTGWYLGVDNSDSDLLKIGTGTAVGTNTIWTIGSTQSFTGVNLRVGATGILSQDNERLSLRYTAVVGDAALSSTGGFIQYTNSNDTNFTSFQRALCVDWRRAITANTTDSGATIAALSASPVFTVTGGAVTYTLSTTFSSLLIGSAALSGGGALAIASYAGINVAANSVATGTRKTGILISAQSGATNNARLADTATYVGDWACYFSSTSSNHFNGSVYVGGIAAHSFNTEKVSSTDTVTGDALNHANGAFLLIANGNTAFSSSGDLVGVCGGLNRTTTGNVTDTVGRMSAVLARMIWTIGGTYTNATTNGVNFFSTSGFPATGGTQAITHFSGYNMGVISTVTGTNFYGVRIQGITGANTNNYGVYVGDITTAGTGNYAIYTNAGLVRFGGIMQAAAGLRTLVSTANTANPPTDAELDSAFGTPATVGTGFIALLDDNNAGTNVYLCAAVGSKWWTAALTEAV